MSSRITLNESTFDESVEKVAHEIRSGGIAILAAESGYMYICDAFSHDAISRVHTLRGDEENTASQIFVGTSEVLKGLALDFDKDYQELARAFWPGLLTFFLTPHSGLQWNLGDSGQLAEFAVRVPQRDFLRAVVANVGPVAAASAANRGAAAIREITLTPAMDSDIAIFVDEGVLPEGPASTILRRAIVGSVGGIEIMREGAISESQLRAVLPTIMARTSE